MAVVCKYSLFDLVKAVLFDVHQLHYTWSWEYFQLRRNQRLSYINLFTKCLEKMDLGSIGSTEEAKKLLLETDRSILLQLEKSLSVDDLWMYREMARQQFKVKKSKVQKESPSTLLRSWFNWGSPDAKETVRIGFMVGF